MTLLRSLAVVLVTCLLHWSEPNACAQSVKQVIRTAQSKVVKVYGAGGLRQLEAYQSGVLISPEGHVLTALSYVLDTDDLAVVLNDGRKWEAEYLGSDPISEIALLKLPAADQALPYFELNANSATPSQRILALSNLYGIATGDEAVSVLQGVITAVAPLRARRGAYQANYNGDVYVLDAYANNPGAAGGALIDWQGRLLGVLGKELRSEVTGTWLNYALPTSGILDTVEALKAGRLEVSSPAELLEAEAHSAERLGISLLPDVLPRTPPYVDGVRRGSPAQRAGIRVDDLVVFLNGAPIDSHKTFARMLRQADIADRVSLSVLREGQLREFTLTMNEKTDEPMPAVELPEDDQTSSEPDDQQPAAEQPITEQPTAEDSKP